MSFVRFPCEDIKTNLSKNDLQKCKKIYQKIRNFLLIERKKSRFEKISFNKLDRPSLINEESQSYQKVRWEPRKKEGWRRLSFEEFMDFYQIK